MVERAMDHPRPDRVERRRKLIIGMAIVAAISLTTVIAIVSARRPNSYPMDEVATVKLSQLKRSIRAVGSIVSIDTSLVPALVSGVVQSVYIVPGEPIAADTILVTLEDAGSRLAKQEVSLRLADSKARRITEMALLEQEYRDLEAHITKKDFEFQARSLDLEASRRLFQEGLVSEIEHSKADLRHQETKAQLALLRQEHNQFAELRDARVESLNVMVEAALSVFKNAERQVDLLTIHSDIDGIVQTVDVQLGQAVQVGQAVSSVAPSGGIRAQLDIPANHADNVSIGTQVLLKKQDGRSIRGSIDHIEPALESGFLVVRVKSTSEELGRVGEIVQATLTYGKKRHILLVRRPGYAVQNETNQVFVINSDRSIDRRKVQFGDVTDGFIEVVAGLSEGDTIALQTP